MYNISTLSSSGSDTLGSHMYVNLAELKRECNRQHETGTLLLPTPEIIDVIIHQEEPEMELLDPPEDELYYGAAAQMSGGESPPLDCNLSLISTEPRHTM